MDNNSRKPLDLNAVRDKLARTQGKQFWKSFEELADTDEFQNLLRDEFPQQARTWGIHIDRRSFLHLMGASLALAGMSGCRFLPDQHIIPYVKQPEEEIPGIALFFASAFIHGGYATGILVESHEGRPTKVEGNPDHPASLGSTDLFAQASTLNFYDPDRSINVRNLGEVSTFTDLLAAAHEILARTPGGEGVRILTESFSSPTLLTQVERFLKKYPKAKWLVYEPVGRDNVHQGTALAFGQPLNPVYHFDKADVVLSLDADIFGDMPGCVRYGRDFMDRRRVHDDQTSMNRLYHVETTPLITGVVADHSAPLRQFELEAFARAVASRLQVDAGAANAPPLVAGWLDPLIKDLQGSRTKSIVIAGEHQPPAVHALAHAMNTMLGNVGTTVTYTAPIEGRPAGYVSAVDSLRDLTNDLNADKVDLLLILGGNPVYNAPNDIDFAGALKRYSDRGGANGANRGLSAHVSLHVDETSILTQWHVNGTHPLETWGDARAYDGTACIVQPLILPLYGGKSDIDVISALLAEPGSAGPAAAYDLVRDQWRSKAGGIDYDKFWQTILNNGVIPATAAPTVTPTLKSGFAASLPPATPQPTSGLDIVIRADPTLHDGRFANNGWLMELPKPITRVTWDNCAYISPKTAVDLGVISENQLELLVGGKKLTVPVWVIPGQPDNAITLHLGYGRERAGQVGNGVGFNAYNLRASNALYFASGATATVAPGNYGIACVEHHWNIDTKAGTPGVTGVASLTDKSPWDKDRLDPNMDPEHPNNLTIDTQQGRHVIHFGAIDEYRKKKQENASLKPGEPKHIFWDPDDDDPSKLESMYDDARNTDHKYEGFGTYAWGMSIDLNVCTGCQACVVACEAENNTPVIGKEQVARGREMQWLRIDRYYRGNSIERPEVYFQPLMCVHCENAPCEPVCPVAATVHSHEGLNQMVYNRCVGTRYCSNNCPYKVRRFNFLNYADHEEDRTAGEYMSGQSLHLLQNPNVTVRGRGVMEKCSYCVQRINAARIEAKKQDREIKDGEVVTACQQACPTRAIVFGNIKDPNSAVAKLKDQEHAYDLLADLNTRPRTSYLAKVTNANPDIKTE